MDNRKKQFYSPQFSELAAVIHPPAGLGLEYAHDIDN